MNIFTKKQKPGHYLPFNLFFLNILICILISGFSLRGLYAQEKKAIDHFKSRYGYFGTHRIHDQWSIYTEVQVRLNDFVQSKQLLIIRPAVNYHFKKNLTFSGGYTYLGRYPHNTQAIQKIKHEHNIWEQVRLSQKLGRVKLKHRYRLEQRWIGQFKANTNETWDSDGYQYANRMRYRMKFTIPLNHAQIKPGTFFLNISDEVWLNADKHIFGITFNQNWLCGALGYQFNQQGNVQLGLLHQQLRKGNTSHYDNYQVLQLDIIYNLDFRHNN